MHAFARVREIAKKNYHRAWRFLDRLHTMISHYYLSDSPAFNGRSPLVLFPGGCFKAAHTDRLPQPTVILVIVSCHACRTVPYRSAECAPSWWWKAPQKHGADLWKGNEKGRESGEGELKGDERERERVRWRKVILSYVICSPGEREPRRVSGRRKEGGGVAPASMSYFPFSKRAARLLPSIRDIDCVPPVSEIRAENSPLSKSDNECFLSSLPFAYTFKRDDVVARPFQHAISLGDLFTENSQDMKDKRCKFIRCPKKKTCNIIIPIFR